MPSAPTSPTYKNPSRFPRARSMPPPTRRLTPAAIMQRKAEAERRMSKLREVRMHREETRSQLRSAEADAGRSAAILRTTLRELDCAVVQLREAKEKIDTAVEGKKDKAHEKCVKRSKGVIQVRTGGAKMGMVHAASMRPVAGTA